EDAGELRLEVVTHLGEEAALNEFVGSGLQIIAAALSARNQTGYGDDLRLFEDFLAVDVDFAQRCVDGVRRLRRCGESGRQEKKRKKGQTSSKIGSHIFRISGNGPGYSTVTDLAKLRGWSTSQPRRTAMWEASNWRGMIASKGTSISGEGGSSTI